MLRAMLYTAQNQSASPLPVSALAQLFKASGDRLRAEILRVIQRDSFSVQELCQIFDIRQPAMSHHLKVLSEVNLVSTRREGNTYFYRRRCNRDAEHNQIVDLIFRAIDSAALSEETLARLEQVRVSRAEKSHQFFVENADRFREQQDLIAGHSDYGSSILELIDACDPKHSSAIDVGCGPGELLPGLATRFQSVLGIDIAESILEKARNQNNKFDNIRCRVAEPGVLVTEGVKADLVSCNMVLHHTSSPEQMIAAMAGLLLPGGQLLITDLCKHDQDWARDNCGDQWLGFEPEELSEWTGNQGLEEGKHQFLALRNGFRIQIRQFINGRNLPNQTENGNRL